MQDSEGKGREGRRGFRIGTVPDIRETLIRTQNDLLGFTKQSVTGHFEGLFQRIIVGHAGVGLLRAKD